MAPRIVAGLFQSEGIAEDAYHRLKTEGVPAVDIGRKVLKEIGRPPERMEPELEAGFLGPLLLGNFRETFAPYISQWRDARLRPGGDRRAGRDGDRCAQTLHPD